MDRKPKEVVEDVVKATQRRLPNELEATGELEPRRRRSFRIRIYVGKEDPEPLAVSPDLQLHDFERDQRRPGQPETEDLAEGLAKGAIREWERRRSTG